MFWSISKHADKSKSSWFCYLGVKILLISLRELSEFPWNAEKLFSSKFQVLEIFRKQGNFDLISVNSKKGKYFILSAFWILKTFMPRKVQRKGFFRYFLVSFIFRGRQITVHSIVMATCLLQSWMRRDLKVTFRKSRHVLYHGLYSKSVKITWKAKKGSSKGIYLKIKGRIRNLTDKTENVYLLVRHVPFIAKSAEQFCTEWYDEPTDLFFRLNALCIHLSGST